MLQKEDIILNVKEKYSLNEVLSKDIFACYKNVYVFAYCREYNYHNINPKLMDLKGAFGNLGFVVNKKNLVKKTLIVNSEKIFFDLLKIENQNEFEVAVNNDRFEYYMGVFYGKEELSIQNVLKGLESIIAEYFKLDYLDVNEHKISLLMKYFKIMLSFNYEVGLLLSNLKGQLKLISVSDKEESSYSLSLNDIIYFPFLRKYSDYLNWKSIRIQ